MKAMLVGVLQHVLDITAFTAGVDIYGWCYQPTPSDRVYQQATGSPYQRDPATTTTVLWWQEGGAYGHCLRSPDTICVGVFAFCVRKKQYSV